MVCLHPGSMGGGVMIEALWEGWPWNTLIRSYETEDFTSLSCRITAGEHLLRGLVLVWIRGFMECREKRERAGRADSVRGVKERSHGRDKDIGFSDPCWDGRMDEERENMEIKRSRWLTKNTDWSDNVTHPGKARWSDKQSKLFHVNHSFCPYQLWPQETTAHFYGCLVSISVALLRAQRLLTHSTKHSRLI